MSDCFLENLVTVDSRRREFSLKPSARLCKKNRYPAAICFRLFKKTVTKPIENKLFIIFKNKSKNCKPITDYMKIIHKTAFPIL